VCYNSAATISATLSSVAKQTYPYVEHLIIDGQSTDDTISIIQREGSHVARVISEPDEGIYDAMNKGLSFASGDLVAFLNSDDVYSDSEVLADVACAFDSNSVDFVYGDLLMLNEKGDVVRDWKSGEIPPAGLTGTQIPHPVLFVKRSLLNQIEPSLDSSYRIAADLKQQLIIINKLKANGFYIRRSLVKMAIGGTSTNGLRSYLEGWKESGRAYNEVFGQGGVMFTVKKVLSKFKGLQFNRKRIRS
jgi:glycosyltransferase